MNDLKPVDSQLTDTESTDTININKALLVIDLFSSTDKSIKQCCEEIGLRTWDFYGLKGTSNIVNARFRQARELRADSYVEEMIEIADSEPDPQTAKNRIQTRQWIAGKFNRKDYGEVLEIDHTVRLDLSGVLNEARRRAKIVDNLLITDNEGK